MPDTEIERNSLLGLDRMAVCVRVSGLANSAQRLLQTDVERRLSKAGITPLGEEDWAKTPGRPSLLAIARIPDRTDTGRDWCRVQVELRQEVFLVRAPALSTWTATWQVERWVPATKENQADDPGAACRDALLVLVDQFLEAHRSVNPKG